MFLGEILCTFCKMINTKNVLTYKLKLFNDADLQGNSAQGSIIVMVLRNSAQGSIIVMVLRNSAQG